MSPRLAAIVSVLVCCRAGISAAQPGARDAPSRGASEYETNVRRALDGTWQPDEVFRTHPHGGSLGPWRVALQISVSADGALRDVVVESSSGLPPFDDAAVRAVRSLQPFPAPPPELVDPDSAVFSFPFSLFFPGWQPPQYTGDPLVRSPETRSWELGSSLDLDRRTTALRGTTSIPQRASYERITATMTASHYLEPIGMLEVQVPAGMIRYREPSIGTSAEVSGLGDVSLHLHRFRRTGGWSRGYFVGLRVPTGETAATPLVGQMLPTVVQMGSGTFDPEFGACLNLQLGDLGALGACDHGRVAVYSNSHGYRDGLEFHGRLLLTVPLLARHMSVQSGLLYEHQGAARSNGEDLPSTGHHVLFAEASVWVLVFRGLSLRSTIELPVYEAVSGMQLADTLRVMAGLSYDFDRR
jgi:TonB family protein